MSLWPESFWKPGDKLFGAEGDEGLTTEQQELLKSLDGGSPQNKALAAQLRRDWLADKAAITQGHLATATGTITQAKPKVSGRPQFGSAVMQDFAFSPHISKAPQSLGGAAMAPVDRDVLYPEETKGITKRSPWWSLMGYSA
tara:strand:+ start:1028 stop:1453 length:426 start_codon:yes stop_codon:yes gene_type:complete